MAIALIPMSAKPYHRGHHMLVLTALKECSYVFIFVGLGDRENISGKAMLQIWENNIVHNFPENVTIHVDGSPIRGVWTILGAINDSVVAGEHTDEFIIYGGIDGVGTDDLTNRFSDELMKKYVPCLLEKKLVSRRLVPRQLTNDISGAKMRAFIKEGNRASFMANMPSFPQEDLDAIWTTLRCG